MSVIARLNQRRQTMFYGWWVTMAGTLINALGVGIYFYGWSTFYKPLINEFGWSRTATAGVSSLSRLEGGIEGPIVGWLIDRIGAKALILAGAVVTGGGFIALWMVDQHIWKLYVIFGILAFGYNAGFSHGTTAAVAKWFVKARSRALAILTTGNAVGGAVLVPVAAFLISQYGWRWAGTIIGVSLWVTVIPLALLFIKNTPEEVGLAPDGGPVKAAAMPSAKAARGHGAQAVAADDSEVNLTWREALRTQAFWIYTLSMLLRSSILSSIVLHQPAHLEDLGFSPVQSASVLALMIFFSAPGRFIFGWVGDYMNKKLLLFILCAVQALGIFIFIHATTLPLLYLFVIVYGPAYGGAMPLTMALRADLFGRKAFATINGMVTSVTAIGGVLGPIFAGYIYDVTKSYSMAFYTFMVLILMGGVFFLFIRQPKLPASGGLAGASGQTYH